MVEKLDNYSRRPGRPRGSKLGASTSPRTRFTFDVHPETPAMVDEEARRRKVSISLILNEAINFYLVDLRTSQSLEDFLQGAKRNMKLFGLTLPRRLQEQPFRDFIKDKMAKGVSLEATTLHPQLSTEDPIYRLLDLQYKYLTGAELSSDLQRTHQVLDELLELHERNRKVGEIVIFGSVTVLGIKQIPFYDIAMNDSLSSDQSTRVELVLG